MITKSKSNTYANGDRSAIGVNSTQVVYRDFVTVTGGYLAKSTAGSEIYGTSKENATMAADNQTVAKKRVVYEPVKAATTFDLKSVGQRLTFAGALVALNVINLKVNGVAMTPVTYAVGNDDTLDAIALQLQTDFPTVIYSATRTTTRIINIVPYVENTGVVITDIVVTLGAGQTTGAASTLAMAKTDEGKFYDIATITHYVLTSTASASSGQVQLVKYLSANRGKFKIANT